MLYKFKLEHNTAEETKNICGMKGEDAIDHSTVVTRWFKKFCSGCKNLDNQVRTDRFKSMNSKVMVQEANMVGSSQTFYFTIQWASLPSQSQQKHPELQNFFFFLNQVLAN